MIRLTIERLRAGVLAGAVLLILGVGGVLLYAHYRARLLLRELPSRLGVDIQKQTSGVTYSQTLKGRTVFTLHAAKATQRKNGETELEDAGVVLYGDGDGRADRIYGKSFQYDQPAGLIRALGTVQLDLEAPAPVSAEDRLRFASGAVMPGVPGAKGKNVQQPVHVITSDLVYSQRSGMATTDAPVHFEYEGMVGDARGASYDARTGYTVFDSAIRLRGEQDGRPFAVTAEHGEFDRAADRLTLRAARMESAATGAEAQQLAAGVLVLHMAEGGGVDQAEGSGGVELVDGGGTARAPLGEMVLRAGNRPERVRLWGGVQFARAAEVPGGEAISGVATEGLGRFDASGVLASVLLSQAVIDGVTAGEDDHRRLSGRAVELELVGVPGSARRWVRQITADGAAELRGMRAGLCDTLAADRLVGQLVLDRVGAGVATSARLDTMTGQGHVVLQRVAPGILETSHAETIEARFVGGGVKAVSTGGARAMGGVQVGSVVEGGGVVLDRESRKPDGTVERLHATARGANYDGSTQRAVLAGDAVLTQGADNVRAAKVVLLETTGDAEAIGQVEATLMPEAAKGRESTAAAQGAGTPPGAAQEPVHAVAAHATFAHDSDVVTLFGEGGEVARLWQGASQVEAPVITVRQREATLGGRGGGGESGAVVRTVLAEDSAKDGRGRVGAAAAARVVRVESESLHYADAKRQAEFVGAVVLQSVDGVLSAQRAVATLAERGKATGGDAGRGQDGTGLLGGSLERVVAEGDVTLKQPGRVATGQQIVYTAADELFVLTGTAQRAPRVVDEVTGSVTGAVLRFHAGDNSVVIDGDATKGKPGRVHTELRMKQ